VHIQQTSLEGVLVFVPAPVRDDRGWFTRTFTADVFGEAGIDHTRLVQDSQSRSVHRTVRGLHGRRDGLESKLVRCANGQVFEVVVDLRPRSSTFLRWEQFVLDDVDHHHLYVPAGCAHGYQVLSPTADICYRMDEFYEPDAGFALAWDDPDLAIPWPVADPILSPGDRTAPTLAELRPQLESWFGA
jgi:dTDP-4-dehydrorhamnose 3,5-epimerase